MTPTDQEKKIEAWYEAEKMIDGLLRDGGKCNSLADAATRAKLQVGIADWILGKKPLGGSSEPSSP